VAPQTQRFGDEVREAADFVRGVLGEAEVALVLGSGLNGFIDVLEDRKELPYAEIPHMPTTTVKVRIQLSTANKWLFLRPRVPRTVIAQCCWPL
jgi:purine nucleoside phosphorylase